MMNGSMRLNPGQMRGSIGTPRFPSPRPSPQGRGRIVVSGSTSPKRSDFSRDGVRNSLSQRERAGVKGNHAHDAPSLRHVAGIVEQGKTSGAGDGSLR